MFNIDMHHLSHTDSWSLSSSKASSAAAVCLSHLVLSTLIQNFLALRRCPMQQTMTPCDLQMRSHNLCEGSQCLCNPLHKLFAKTGCRICAGTSRLVRPDFIVQSKLVRWPGTCINSQPHCFFKLKQISNGPMVT